MLILSALSDKLRIEKKKEERIVQIRNPTNQNESKEMILIMLDF
jgi:hypothetical protein